MKLPWELSWRVDTVQDRVAKYEAIVRHCAKLAGGFDTQAYENPRRAIERAILKEFDLG